MCEYCEMYNDIPASFYEDANTAAWAVRFAQDTDIKLKSGHLFLHGRQGLDITTPFSWGLLAHAWALYRPVGHELVDFFEQEGLLYSKDANGRTLAEVLAYNLRASVPASTHKIVCANGIDSICHLLAARGVFTPVLEVANGNGYNSATLLYEAGNLPEIYYNLVQWDLIFDPAQDEVDRIKSYILSYDY